MTRPIGRLPACLLLSLASAASAAGSGAVWDPWNAPTARKPAAKDGLGIETSPARIVGTVAIRAYQRFLSPVLPGGCQFQPSCSGYALRCIVSHGLLNGAWMGSERISRCHGFALLGGYPVSRAGWLLDPPDDLPAPIPALGWIGL